LRGIRRIEPSKYRTIDELCMQMQSLGYDVADMYAHFYILFELGVISVGTGFRLQFRNGTIDLTQSRVYQNLCKLRERK